MIWNEITHKDVFKYWWKITPEDNEKYGDITRVIGWAKVVAYSPDNGLYYFKFGYNGFPLEAFQKREYRNTPPEDVE